MDVLVNIQSLQPPITGIGRYTSELLNHLILEHNIQAFDATKNYTKAQLTQKLNTLNNAIETTSTQNKIRASIKEIARGMPYSYQIRQAIQQKINQSQLEKCSDYIYWDPNYILQPFDGKSIATIHDLSYIQHPQHHAPSSIKWLENNIEASIQQANAIITLSEFSKKEILKYFSIAESKISIIPPSVSDEFKKAATTEELENIRVKHQLPERYILSVGTLEPRKNIKSLLKAYALLPKKLRRAYPLVLVGAKGWGDVAADIQIMVDKKEILVLGYIAQEDIPILYKAADLFVYISLYEGYGMPVAEAMASGVAVITSENSAMSEITCGAVELVNPLDIEQISRTIGRYLQNADVRKNLIEKSTLITQGWSWKNSANKLNTLLQSLA